MLKKMVSVLLVLVMAVSMTACSGNGVEAYRNELNNIVKEVEEINPEVEKAVENIMQALQDADEAAYNTALEALENLSEKLKEKYNAMANVEAPKEYADDQGLMQGYAADIDEMLEASMEMYRIMYDYVVNGNITDEILEKVTELQDTIIDKAEATTSFDEVLNRVLGNSEK